ncbi:hypothetical protein JZO70_02020 [Enterococcus sp. 669A]|uniref:Uncharacterized protein n=1 Tax=Candidatus Enterococcus moelleringii TaxID=2815325 RepID=A0ABS3L5N4_9ENTE|nr:hypothetical protein [Enterococcus sp. 669A]MBO1304922.1 hypothetical protein [Enterococcus sp. 669A]
MATFGKMTTQIDPSEAGKDFPVQTRVTFTVRNQPQTGVITKQLKNAAVVEIDENTKNAELINQSNGVVVINYKEMKKIQ